jgi:hypothetical protein
MTGNTLEKTFRAVSARIHSLLATVVLCMYQRQHVGQLSFLHAANAR